MTADALAPHCRSRIGPHTVRPPVVLAPMAGITNAPFRTLCREFSGGKGLFVSEMITTRALVERNEKTMQLIHFDATEKPRSIQLYGVDPVTVGKAVRMIADEDLADHIDLNFGCPVPKVTRKGGGSALPYKRQPAARDPARGGRRAPGDLPVTIKMRKGIDDDHLTYLDAGRIAVEEGVTAVALHGRTAAQHYGGTADWDAIARLKEHVPEIPVLGNGDIWCGGRRAADDARDRLRRRGRRAAAAWAGRGCSATWSAAFEGARTRQAARRCARSRPSCVRHADAARGVDRRRGARRDRLPQARGLVPQGLLGRLRDAQAARGHLLAGRAGRAAGTSWTSTSRGRTGADGPRGRTSGNNRVVLPDGWLKDPYDCAGVERGGRAGHLGRLSTARSGRGPQVRSPVRGPDARPA